jgi:zinc/manganese transport system substrate-binding protein
MAASRLRLPVALAAAAASIVSLAGCASPAASGDDDGRIAVVASTSVYGQIAEEIGGDLVDVTSIISSAGQDPHSFEPSAKDQLAVRHADLVIENGAGYDAFMDALIEASGSSAPVLTAAEFSSEWPGGAAEDSDGHHDHGDEHIEGFNEHVWYDLEAMGGLARGIQAKLESLSPDDADTFTANLDEFLAGIGERAKELSAMDAAHGGTGIFVTEPVPLYLTGAAGLVNLAPEAFTEAVEEGQDVAPATLYEALDLLRSGDVKLLIANSQTGGAETALVIAEAAKRSIPVLEFSETLPAGKTYLSWMQANIDALSEGLGA